MQSKTGVLLVNLGTPNSPEIPDVHRYLVEFLTDPRVIDMPWLKRQLLVRGAIVPSRCRQSAASYKKIWTAEGSPLMVYGKKVANALQHRLGENYQVELAMRYQQPSLAGALQSLLAQGIQHLIVLPLFPQYASATTGSVHQRVQEELLKLEVMPKVTLISQFATHPALINAFSAIAADYKPETYDHILFSFHGLPMSHIYKATPKGNCSSCSDCCRQLNSKNMNCYSAQCFATAHAIAKQLGLTQDRFSISFQSRLGKDPWLEPATIHTVEKLAKNGTKKVLVMCPAFVCDCLETTFEIGVENAHDFKKAGGERLDLVAGLNDHPLWIAALEQIVIENK